VDSLRDKKMCSRGCKRDEGVRKAVRQMGIECFYNIVLEKK